MKRYLVIILLFLCYINVEAQAWIYHPMPLSNAIWRVDDQNDYPCSPAGLYASYQYTLGGDTTIGSYTYKKIFISGIREICLGTPTGFNWFYGGLRNDSINKKVYYWNFGSDTLLYDFSLQVGDTVYDTYNSVPLPYWDFRVNVIDSVLVGSNYHKRFNLNGGYSYIEGVGSPTGLLEPLGVAMSDLFQLMCFSYNSEFYPSSTSSCPLVDITVGISEIHTKMENLTISPNPLSSESLIELDNKSDIIKEINIYNPVGELMVSDKNVLSSKYIVKRNQFSAGVYFVKVITRDNNIIVSKLIVN